MNEMTSLESVSTFTQAAIFGRVVENSGEISPQLAEHILSLEISEHDQRRVNVLLKKNAGGTLTESEREELENLNHIADLVSLMRSRARRSQKLP